MKRRKSGSVRIDKNGQRLSAAMWTKLRGNSEYTIIEEYNNGEFYANVEWLGMGENESKVPKEYWRLFKVNVGNIILTGDRPGTYVKKKVSDPTLEKHFPTLSSAKFYYQEVLTSNKCATMNETYEGEIEFKELNNLIESKAKSELKTKDIPATKNKYAGSW